MIFSITRDGGPPCVKCESTEGSVSTVVRRGVDYKWATVTICEACIFKAILGDTAYQRAINVASKPLDSTFDDVRQGKLEYLSLLEGGAVKPRKWWQL